jgi:hypothetical protein
LYFSNLENLIKHYYTSKDNLCCCLTKPCIVVPKIDINSFANEKAEVSQNQLQIEIKPSKTKLYVALDDFKASSNDEMSFKKHDHLEVLYDTPVCYKLERLRLEKGFKIILLLFRKFGGKPVTYKARKDGYRTIILYS